MLQEILGGVIIAAALAAIVIRPYRIPEAASAAAGAILLVAGAFSRSPTPSAPSRGKSTSSPFSWA